MKVNISYSVELDEVLENVRHLFLKTEEMLREKETDYTLILKNEYTDENLGAVIKTINDYRETVAKFDLKLGEMINILLGYYRLKYQPPAAPADEVSPEEESPPNTTEEDSVE